MSNQAMDSITKRVMARLEDRPVQDTVVYQEEVRYCWVDEDDQRVSPVHKDFGKALSWLANWPDKVSRLKNWQAGKTTYTIRQDSMDRLELSISLTGKPPVQLKRVVIRTIAEPIANHEIESVNAMMSTLGIAHD